MERNDSTIDDVVAFNMVCDRCGAEYDWRAGDEPASEFCPACRGAESELGATT